MPRRIKLIIEYDGTDFKGWQVQSAAEAGGGAGGADASNQATQARPAVRTVQGVVEQALLRATGHSIRIAGASRTDAGVHARGQTASLLLPDEVSIPTGELCRALNGNMSKDVTAVAASEADINFHAQRDATGKIYSYSLLTRYERPALLRRSHWHVRFDLDLPAMRQAAKALIGRHDFTSFATRLKETQARRLEEGRRELETVRDIRRIEIEPDPNIPRAVIFRIEGSGFLYQMVRTISGSLVDVGRGFRSAEWLGQALAAKDRRAAGPTAPPHGLCLEQVLY
jgi:tRNA pseudouridine38-40 synthase